MPAAPTWSNATLLVEAPESPSYKIGEGGIFKTLVYHGTYAQCVASIVYRGWLGTGDNVGYIVDSCSITRDKGERGRLEIVFKLWGPADGGEGIQLPADEVELSPVDASPRIERHPYWGPDEWNLDATDIRETLDLLQKSYSPTAEGRQEREDDYAFLLSGQKDLYDKISRGQEVYYFANWQYVWTEYSWTLPSLADGGVTETPGGPLAGALGSDLTWLRLADQLRVQNGAYAVTHTWLGAPEWDSDLYPSV